MKELASWRASHFSALTRNGTQASAGKEACNLAPLRGAARTNHTDHPALLPAPSAHLLPEFIGRQCPPMFLQLGSVAPLLPPSRGSPVPCAQ